MNHDELRQYLPPLLTIKTLGGRVSLMIENPPVGDLRVTNSRGSSYRLTHHDWATADSIRRANPRNPWKTSLYTELGEFFSYSLVHAAALLRHIEQDGTLAAPSPVVRFHDMRQNTYAA